jgi:hypothetical protein
VFEKGELLCITVYRKGAHAVAARISSGPQQTASESERR